MRTGDYRIAREFLARCVLAIAVLAALGVLLIPPCVDGMLGMSTADSTASMTMPHEPTSMLPRIADDDAVLVETSMPMMPAPGMWSTCLLLLTGALALAAVLSRASAAVRTPFRPPIRALIDQCAVPAPRLAQLCILRI